MSMAFTLDSLPYEYDALEPYIDAKTMELHHTKHHQAYIDKLNAAIEGEDWFEDKSIEELVKQWEDAPQGKKDIVRNHGGGHANHTFFWKILVPGGNKNVSSELQDQIEKEFGSLDECMAKVTDAAVTHFGSGWGWLVVNKDGLLEALSTPNQNSPLMYDANPLLGIDVWEHAYYLTYQSKRAEYVKAIWNVINWEQVSENYAAVLQSFQ